MTASGSAPSTLGPLARHVQRAGLAIELYGLTGVAKLVARRVRRRPARSFTAQIEERVARRRGLEIGGPTMSLFGPRRLLPIYPLAARIDNVNFAAGQTHWENVVAGDTFVFDTARAPGTQFVGEATALPMIADGAYDFLLSSHTIEHTANPLRALREWRRVLSPGALLVLVAPDPTRTFDHRRPITTLAHLVEDEANGTSENDLSHMDEIVRLHDLKRDIGAPQDRAEFAARCGRNSELRCLHHHVFDLSLLRAAVERVGFKVLDAERALANNLIVLAEVPV